MMEDIPARLDLLATTLSTDSDNFGTVSAAGEMGLRLRWTAEQDACNECMELDGETYDADLVMRPPLHPNCRCQLVLVEEGFEGRLVYNASIFADADKDHYARIYLIDTSVCGNNWQVTDAALERAAKSLIGKPLMIGHGAPEGSEVGVFTDYLKEDGRLYGLAKITNEGTWKHIVAGDWKAVSVEFVAKKISCSVCGADTTKEPDAHILDHTGHEVIEDFEFDAVGLVDSPAYPRAKVEEVNGHHEVWPAKIIASTNTSVPPLQIISTPNPQTTTITITGAFSGTSPDDILWSNFSRRLTAELAKQRAAQALAPEDTSWDLTAAETNDLPDAAFAWIDPDYPDKSSDKNLRKLPHHKMIGGTLKVVWRGVAAAMAVLLGARGGIDLPRDDKRKVYEHLAAHYRQFDKEAPEFKTNKEEGDKLEKITEAEKRIAELEKGQSRIAELDKQVEALTKAQTEIKAKLDEPNPKAKAGEAATKIEDTRVRLFGYRRDRMASDGGKIVG